MRWSLLCILPPRIPHRCVSCCFNQRLVVWRCVFGVSPRLPQGLDGSWGGKNWLGILKSWHVPVRRMFRDHRVQLPYWQTGKLRSQNGEGRVQVHLGFSERIIELKVKAGRASRSSSQASRSVGTCQVLEFPSAAGMLPVTGHSLLSRASHFLFW